MSEDMVPTDASDQPIVDAKKDAPSPAGITQRQFVRGIDAINRYREMVATVALAMRAGGCDSAEDLGGGALLEELTKQLCERCNDPVVLPIGTAIEYMLYDCGGPITTTDGRRFMVKTPEQLWIYWREVGEGPFMVAALGPSTTHVAETNGRPTNIVRREGEG